MKVNTVIGDAAYSEKANIEYTKEEKIALVAKLNPILTQGPRKEEDKFEFNKDAGMFVCKAGHLATRKARTGKKKQVRIKHSSHLRDSFYLSLHFRYKSNFLK